LEQVRLLKVRTTAAEIRLRREDQRRDFQARTVHCQFYISAYGSIVATEAADRAATDCPRAAQQDPLAIFSPSLRCRLQQRVVLDGLLHDVVCEVGSEAK
jgi:hypothetical protein